MAGPIARWWWCLPAALVAGCAANTDDTLERQDSLTGFQCGMEILASPQTISHGTVCEDGRVVYADRIARTTGQPETVSDTFTVETSGTVCVMVRNGNESGNRISSGTVAINGASLAEPRDFSQKWGGFESEVDLGLGTHTVEVELASTPGAYVDIEVREFHPELSGGVVVVGPNGALQLTNPATDHPLMTPNGDGHHDDTVFNIDGEPLVTLPGKDDGSVAYFLDWTVLVWNLDTCQFIDVGLSGQQRINSPTNVQATWDGTDSTGTMLPAGNYAYAFEVSLVREDGYLYDTAVTPTYGMIIDTAPADYNELPTHQGLCDLLNDPHGAACLCPGGGGVGTGDPDCYFDRPNHLERFDDPTTADLSFISSSQGPDGRWRVVVDLREFNAGGLLWKQGLGTWDSEAELRQWVSQMTGVPVGTGTSLFNFDYTQLGTSTAVKTLGVGYSFNHFFLDAITDEDGKITIDGATVDLAALWHNDETAAPDFQVSVPREDDECTEAGNTVFDSSLRAKFCAYNEGIALSSSLGFYELRTSAFDIVVDGVGSTQDELCIINGIFACGIRTFKKRADITIESQYFVEDGGLSLVFDDVVTAPNVAGLSVGMNRELPGGNADGVCSRAVVVKDGLRVRLDSADGAVSDACIINGIF